MRQTITVLTDQKAAAVSAEATALRKLERDMHDGPQQRLVRLAMDLSRAQQQLDTDPEALRETLADAIGQTRETLDELRALSRGIAPPVLADRGLPSALAAVAGRCTVPVELVVDADLGTAAGPARRGRREHRVLRRLRSADQRRQAQRCGELLGDGRQRSRPVGGADRRRWRRRSACRQGPRPERARRPGSFHRRRAHGHQPGRRADRDQGGAAVLRVVVADDSVLLREGLVRLLTENGHEVVAAVGDGPSLVTASRAAHGRTSRSWTSGCRRRTPTRGCGPRSRPVGGSPAPRCWCCPSTSRCPTPTTCSPTGSGRRLSAQGPGRGCRRVSRRAGPGGLRRHGPRP